MDWDVDSEEFRRHTNNLCTVCKEEVPLKIVGSNFVYPSMGSTEDKPSGIRTLYECPECGRRVEKTRWV